MFFQIRFQIIEDSVIIFPDKILWVGVKSRMVLGEFLERVDQITSTFKKLFADSFAYFDIGG